MVSGCKSIGPGMVARDRFDYSGSISDSWKRQTLLNIVKLRYLDPPIFVDVGQIVSGYTLEYGATVGGTFTSGSNTAAVGGSAKYTDRPTITYVPLTGNQFQRALMTPLPNSRATGPAPRETCGYCLAQGDRQFIAPASGRHGRAVTLDHANDYPRRAP